VTAIARDLHSEGMDFTAYERFLEAPAVPQDPAPYQRAVVGQARDVA
jgi:hypothetical protein